LTNPARAGVGEHRHQLAHHRRGLRRRLEHDRIARRDRRRDLVAREVERRVERRDTRHHAHGEAQQQRELARAHRGTVERTCSPWMRIASSAASSSVSCERMTSAFASLIALPVSRVMISATSPARSTSSAATLRNSAARS